MEGGKRLIVLSDPAQRFADFHVALCQAPSPGGIVRIVGGQLGSDLECSSQGEQCFRVSMRRAEHVGNPVVVNRQTPLPRDVFRLFPRGVLANGQ